MLKTRKGVAALVALVVLALGGATISDASAAKHPRKHSSAQKKRHVKRHSPRAAQAPTETTGSETTGSETAGETSGESSSETAAGNDGPGGHADEPGNPNADHQFNGVE